MFKKFKAMKKSEKLYAISFGLIGTAVATLVTGLALLFVGNIRQTNIARENGYDEANAEHKIEQLSTFEEQYEAGELSNAEYIDRIENIEDLNRSEYIFSDENVPEEAKDEYSSARAMMFVGLGVAPTCAILTCAAYGIGVKASRTSDTPKKEPSRTM